MSEAEADFLSWLMAERFSCRAFRPDPVPEDTIREIVRMAGRSASWSNVQPWDNAIITRPETTQRLSEALLAAEAANPAGHSDLPYPEAYLGEYLARRREVGFGLYRALGIEREDRAARYEHHLRNFRFFGAPHVLLLSVPRELGVYGVLDIGVFVASFLLAAQSHGVASLAQAALAHQSEAVRRFLDLREGLDFVCGISFGYAKPQHPANLFRSSRIDLENRIQFR